MTDENSARRESQQDKPFSTTKDYAGPESSLRTFPLLYAYFDDFDEIRQVARQGSRAIALHDADPRSCTFTLEQVLNDEPLFLRLYGEDLLRIKLPDGFVMFRSIERTYWDRAAHPEKYSGELSSVSDKALKAHMLDNIKQINVHVNVIRLRYGMG